MCVCYICINVLGHGPSMERWAEENSSRLQISNNRLDNKTTARTCNTMTSPSPRQTLLTGTAHHCNTPLPDVDDTTAMLLPLHVFSLLSHCFHKKNGPLNSTFFFCF